MDAKTILVVEDDESLSSAIVTSLIGAGFEASNADCFRDANFNLSNAKFDCILMDIKLKEESGAELIERIRNNPKSPNHKTPILVISGNVDRELVEKIKGKVQGAVVKPFNNDNLIASIQKIVGKAA